MGSVIYPDCWHDGLYKGISWPPVEAPIKEDNEHFQGLVRLEKECKRYQNLEFRVRLEDEYGSALEFSAFGHRSLRLGCFRALNAWTGFLPRHAEVQARLQAFQAQISRIESSISETYRKSCWQLWGEAGFSEPKMARIWKQHVSSAIGQLDVRERLRRELLLIAPQQLTLQVASSSSPHAWKTPPGYTTPLILSVHDVQPNTQNIGALHTWDLRLPSDVKDSLRYWPGLWMEIRKMLKLSSEPTSAIENPI